MDDRSKIELTKHVVAFVPEAQGEELDHRVALLRARDFAAALVGGRTAGLAYWLAREALETAGHFVFADVPAVRLDLATKLCRHLVQASFLADHLGDLEAGHVA